MRRLAILAAALLLLACTSASAITLQTCHIPNVKDALRCGTFVVPENRALKGGRHLNFPTKTVTSSNLLLSILGMYGIHQESIGDSTGPLRGLEG